MLQNQQTEIPSPFYIPPPAPSTAASQALVTPQELTQALNALQANKAREAQQLSGTIPIGQAVDELSLDSTPEEIWRQVQAQRMAVQSVRSQPVYYGPPTGGRSKDWIWPVGLGVLMLAMGWGMSSLGSAPPTATPMVAGHKSIIISQPHHPGSSISAGQSTVINSDNGTLTYTSHGGEMVINGDNDTIRVQGDCDSLTVSGDNDTIVISGSSGSAVINGSNNTLKADTADAVTTSGDNNTVSMPSASSMTIVDNGSNNTIDTGSNQINNTSGTTIIIGQ